jgi:anthranilate synthase component 2
MKILVLDNYDSFTYNLVHYVEDISGQKVDVFRNDSIAVDEVEKYDIIILSPGPGLPSTAGIMPQLIKRYAPTKKILGICLGHQAIAESFGGTLYNLDQVYHGIATPVSIDPIHKIFSGMQKILPVGRYHSWAVNSNDLPKCFSVIARDENGVIMGIKHESYDLTGVQFHPESILTPAGHEMIKNWLQ